MKERGKWPQEVMSAKFSERNKHAIIKYGIKHSPNLRQTSQKRRP